jgi:hypothetical protein
MLFKSLGRRVGTALAVSTAFTLLLAGSARAATIEVNSSADPTDNTNCTLRQAIENAGNNTQTNASCAAGTGDDTITFNDSLVGDTITLTAGELLIDPGATTGRLAIQGPGTVGLEVSGGGSSRVFHIASSAFNDPVTILGLTISNGSVTNANGGGILNEGSLSLDHDLVSGNTVTGSSTGGVTTQATGLGGGIESAGGPLSVSSSQIVGNHIASTAGGGSISNTAIAQGAGIHASGNIAGNLQIDRSSIYDNTATATATATGNAAQATAEGGGVWSSAGVTGIFRSTVANNTLTAGGAGAATQEAGGGVETNVNSMFSPFAAALLDDTVTGNDAANTGANLVGVPGSTGLEIRNTIVADPSGAANCSSVTSLGHNLADDASCSPDGTTDLTGTDPSLLPLADYGGSSLTRPPDVGSPAIDAGFSELTTDQRDLTRPFDFISIPNASEGNGTDIGAVEIQAPAVVPEPTPPSAAPPAQPTKKKCKKKPKKRATSAKKKKCKKRKK